MKTINVADIESILEYVNLTMIFSRNEDDDQGIMELKDTYLLKPENVDFDNKTASFFNIVGKVYKTTFKNMSDSRVEELKLAIEEHDGLVGIFADPLHQIDIYYSNGVFNFPALK